jgi:hypothetical protein
VKPPAKGEHTLVLYVAETDVLKIAGAAAAMTLISVPLLREW